MADSPEQEVEGAEKNRKKSLPVFIAKLTVSLSLVAYLFYLVDIPSFRQQFSELLPQYVGYALIILLCQSFLGSFKWRTLLVADGVVLKYTYLLKTYMISHFVSLFLPTSFGGDIYRVMAVRKAAMSTAKTTSSVLFDRLTGLFALLSLAFVGYLSYPGLPFKWLAVLCYLAGLLVFWLGVSGFLLKRKMPTRNRLLQKIDLVLESFHRYGRNRRCLLIALAISFALQLNIVIANKMYSLAFGLEVPFMVLLAIIPLVYLTEAIPMSINGLGFREGAFVFFYQLIGQTAEAGLGIALLVLSLRYLIGLIGGILLVVTILSDRSKKNSVRDSKMLS